MVNSPTRPSSVRSSGTKPTPASRMRRTLAAVELDAVEADRPLDPGLEPEERLGELGLAVALHAGDGEDLAAAHVEADVVDDEVPDRVDDGEALDHECGLAELRLLLLHGELDGAADHERRELGVRGGGRGLADDLAEADDGDAVGDLAHLAQLVRDEHDRGAALLELAHDAHELVGLLRGEHRGRLVEHEHAGVAGERLDDLDALLHADGEVVDERVGVDVEPEPLGDLAHLRARAAAGRAGRRRLCDSWPSMTFSATVNTGMSMKCWCTMPMPAAMASPGPAKCWTSSSRSTSPSSAW